MRSGCAPPASVAATAGGSGSHLSSRPAADRGQPALLVWTVFIVSAIAGLWRLRRVAGVRPLAAAGLSAMAAMLVAGMSEYNFGDSEFLMLFLVMLTLPFAAARGGSDAG